MLIRYSTAEQFWCASATTAALCFLTPRPLRAFVPLGLGYMIYRMTQHGLPWAECNSANEECSWQDVEEYYPSGLGDPVDDTIQDSFPASDPPSYSPGTAAPVASAGQSASVQKS